MFTIVSIADWISRSRPGSRLSSSRTNSRNGSPETRRMIRDEDDLRPHSRLTVTANNRRLAGDDYAELVDEDGDYSTPSGKNIKIKSISNGRNCFKLQSLSLCILTKKFPTMNCPAIKSICRRSSATASLATCIEDSFKAAAVASRRWWPSKRAKIKRWPINSSKKPVSLSNSLDSGFNCCL